MGKGYYWIELEHYHKRVEEAESLMVQHHGLSKEDAKSILDDFAEDLQDIINSPSLYASLALAYKELKKTIKENAH